MQRADASECLALAPIAFRTRCNLLYGRAQMMERIKPMGKKGKRKFLEEYGSAPGACAGKTPLEMIWDDLDVVVERLAAGAEHEDDKGMALGLASAIAIIENPYRPDVERVRAVAMERWQEKYGEDDG